MLLLLKAGNLDIIKPKQYMNIVIIIFQMILSVSLVVVILLQAKGTGLGTAFGGGGQFYSSKRGMERALFIFTIVLVLLFFATSIANFILF